MKKIAIVRPAVHLVQDGNGNTIRSDYSYAAAPNCHVEVLCYNRDQAPPGGDFLQEQMWVIEGPQESLDIFFSDPRVEEITHADCCTLGSQWDGPKAIKEPVASGSVACCPDCGEALSCPDCGPMKGKTPVIQRNRKGWDAADHEHHLKGVEKRGLSNA